MKLIPTLIALWLCSLLLWIASALVDSYFYPGFSAKRIFVWPGFWSGLSIFFYLSLISYLSWVKIRNHTFPKTHLLIAFVLVANLCAYLPLALLLAHLDKLIQAAGGSKDVIYTTHYHLSYDGVISIFSTHLLYLKLSLLYVALFINWRQIVKSSLTETRELQSLLGRLVRGIFSHAKLVHLVNFVEKWTLLFPGLFFLLLIVEIALSRIFSFHQPLLYSALYSSYYLLALTILLYAILRKQLNVKKENSVFTAILAFSLVILFSVTFFPDTPWVFILGSLLILALVFFLG